MVECSAVCAAGAEPFLLPIDLSDHTASESQIVNQNGATSEFEMCFAIGSQHV